MSEDVTAMGKWNRTGPVSSSSSVVKRAGNLTRTSHKSAFVLNEMDEMSVARRSMSQAGGHLTEEDHIYSSFPYGSRCLVFDNFFFDVANWENGKNWSTPWIVDDAEFFVVVPEGRTLAHLIRPQGRSNVASARRRSSMNRQASFGRALRR